MNQGQVVADPLGMPLHPVLLEKLNAALAEVPRKPRTRRDARLPEIPNKVHSVIGMRRSGKTTFLHQLLDEVRAQGAGNRALYLSFDDDRLATLELEQLSFLLEEYYRIHPRTRGHETVYWYLDEIQLVPGWEQFVRRVLDTENVAIVVSGSSAKLLSREIHTSLRGRGIATVIRPFSFREFLRHQGQEPSTEPRRWKAAERSLLETKLREYLEQGGFPEAQGLSPTLRIELLQGYVDTVLFRDILERYGISQVAALRWIIRHCLRAPAGSISGHRLSKDLRSQGHGVSRDLVETLFGYLTDSFLISAVPLATDSERKKNSNPRKVYPADPALIRAFDSSGRANLGHALETAVFLELERRGADIGYVKTDAGLEVDFLARFPGQGEELIQVCADPTNPETLNRELRAFDDAMREHPRAVARLLVPDRDCLPRTTHPKVQVHTVAEWMLSWGQQARG